MHNNISFNFLYAGGIILLSSILGGGNAQGLWTDHVMQILLLPALFIGLGHFYESKLSLLAKLCIILVLALCVLQFLPISRIWPHNVTGAQNVSSMFSISPGRSLESVLFLLPLIGLSLMISQFNESQQMRLTQFFIVGMLVNFTIVIIQLSFSGQTSTQGPLPFVITSGLFANENHLSSYICSIIPLLAFRYLWQYPKPLIFIILLGIICFVLFAIGSRAGITFSVFLAVCCLGIYALQNQSKLVKTLILLGASTSLIGIVVFYYSSGSIIDNLRLNFLENTIAAIKDIGLFGTGLGTFVVVYPIYEMQSEINSKYANHAHNEYVELLLEAGFIGILIVILYGWAILKNALRTPMSIFASISIAALMAHSLFDYPLRNMSIAILFTYLSTIVLTNHSKLKN